MLYVEKYNSSLKGRNKRFKIEINSPLSDDDKQDIVNSISHQVYHGVNDMSSYFSTITNVDLMSLGSWNTFNPILDKRHRIIHHGSYDIDGNLVNLSIQELSSTLSHAEKMIIEAETIFVSIGHGELFENPDD